jgi:hypothetical protein
MSLTETLQQRYGVGHYKCVASGAGGGVCDLCGTIIKVVNVFRAPNGETVRLGTECSLRTEHPEIVRVAKQATRKAAAARRVSKAASVEAELDALLNDETQRARMASLSHPKFAGRTLLDWAEWMTANAGAKGRAEVLKAVKAVKA